MKPEASLIIPMHNAAGTIERVIERLLLLRDKQPIEIIVVDDGSTDDSVDRVSKFEPQVKIIKLTKNLGRGAARNRGAAVATGPILIFLDADCLPESGDFFQRHLDFHNHKTGALIGYVYTPIQENADAYVQFRFGQSPPINQQLQAVAPAAFATGNASIRAEDFKSVGGLWEHLPLYEDVDFGIRLSEHGLPIFQDRSIVVAHLDTLVTLERDMARNFLAYSKGVHAIIDRHPERLAKLPLAHRFQTTEQSTWHRWKYGQGFIIFFPWLKIISFASPRVVRNMIFSYAIRSAAYNGFFHQHAAFFEKKFSI